VCPPGVRNKWRRTHFVFRPRVIRERLVAREVRRFAVKARPDRNAFCRTRLTSSTSFTRHRRVHVHTRLRLRRTRSGDINRRRHVNGGHGGGTRCRAIQIRTASKRRNNRMIPCTFSTYVRNMIISR